MGVGLDPLGPQYVRPPNIAPPPTFRYPASLILPSPLPSTEVNVTGTSTARRALTAVLLVAGCAVDQPLQRAPLIGAWRSSVQFKTGAFADIKDLEFMYVFNEGGTVTESSNYDGAPPVPPAYGVWRLIRPNEFEAKYEYFATVPSGADVFKDGGGWIPSGRGVFTEVITLSADTKTFTSNIRYEALGLRGEKVDGSGEAEGRAVRIWF